MKKARTALVDGLRMLSLLRPKNVLFGSGFRPTLSNYVRPKLFYELGEEKYHYHSLPLEKLNNKIK